MANKKLIVEVIADSSRFRSGLSESEKAANQFEGKIKGSASAVRSHLFLMAGALVGAGSVVEGLKKSVQAAEDLNVSTRALNAQLKANRENVGAARPVIDGLNASMTKLGFTNSQTEQAFTRLDRASGSTAAAAKYMGVTADFAAAKHIELSQAALIVGKVIDGNTTAMNRYGIAIPKGTSATEALAIMTKKLTGQAYAGATSQKQFHAVLTNIEATIGKALLPTVEKYLNKLTDWFSKSENQRKVTDAVKVAIGYLKDALAVLGKVLGIIRDAFQALSGAVGGTKHALELLLAVFAAFKGAQLAGSIAATATKLGLIGGAAVTAEGEVAALRVGLLGLGGPAVLAALAATLLLLDEISHHTKGHKQTGGTAKLNTEVFEQGGKYYERVTVGRSVVTKEVTKASATALLRGASTVGPGSAHSGSGFGSSGAGLSAGKAKLLSLAKDALGTPYLWGGNAPGGFDCSGLVQWALANGLNINVPRTTYEQVKTGKQVSTANAKVGNVVFTNYGESGKAGPGHEGIIVGFKNGQPIIEAAPKPGGKVQTYTGLNAFTGGGKYTIRDLGAPTSTAGLPGDAAAAAAAAKAATAAEKKKAAAAKAAATAAYQSWKTNYFTPLDNQYKSDLLITDESKRLNKLEALHAKLAIDLKSAKGKEHQDILNEENKVQGKIQAIQKKANDARVRLAVAAAAEIKKQFDRVLALDVSNVLRSFDQAFARQMSAFDKATAAGLTGLGAPAQTAEEKALADFIAGRQSTADAVAATQRQTDLATAISGGDPVQIAAAQDAINQAALDHQQAGLQAAADASRVAADQQAADAQQAYQDARDLQKQGLQDINDDQRLALQNNLDDWTTWLSSKLKTYQAFLAAMRAGGIDTSGLIDPTGQTGGGARTATGAPTFSANSLLGFAAGGVVPGSLGAPMLAVVHGGETVTPAGGGSGGGLTVNVTVQGALLGSSIPEVAKIITREINRDYRRGTGLLGTT